MGINPLRVVENTVRTENRVSAFTMPMPNGTCCAGVFVAFPSTCVGGKQLGGHRSSPPHGRGLGAPAQADIRLTIPSRL